jgi:hypothetical protein
MVFVNSIAMTIPPEKWDTGWKYAVERVEAELLDLRLPPPELEDRKLNRETSLYGVATLGRHSRFFELRPGEDKMREVGEEEGRVYEFKEDEALIDGILSGIAGRMDAYMKEGGIWYAGEGNGNRN